jgi:hypothetical protein
VVGYVINLAALALQQLVAVRMGDVVSNEASR